MIHSNKLPALAERRYFSRVFQQIISISVHLWHFFVVFTRRFFHSVTFNKSKNIARTSHLPLLVEASTPFIMIRIQVPPELELSEINGNGRDGGDGPRQAWLTMTHSWISALFGYLSMVIRGIGCRQHNENPKHDLMRKTKWTSRGYAVFCEDSYMNSFSMAVCPNSGSENGLCLCKERKKRYGMTNRMQRVKEMTKFTRTQFHWPCFWKVAEKVSITSFVLQWDHASL